MLLQVWTYAYTCSQTHMWANSTCCVLTCASTPHSRILTLSTPSTAMSPPCSALQLHASLHYLAPIFRHPSSSRCCNPHIAREYACPQTCACMMLALNSTSLPNTSSSVLPLAIPQQCSSQTQPALVLHLHWHLMVYLQVLLQTHTYNLHCRRHSGLTLHIKSTVLHKSMQPNIPYATSLSAHMSNHSHCYSSSHTH